MIKLTLVCSCCNELITDEKEKETVVKNKGYCSLCQEKAEELYKIIFK